MPVPSVRMTNMSAFPRAANARRPADGDPLAVGRERRRQVLDLPSAGVCELLQPVPSGATRVQVGGDALRAVAVRVEDEPLSVRRPVRLPAAQAPRASPVLRPPPSASITKTARWSCTPRPNAIRFPSGDHAGCPSSSPAGRVLRQLADVRPVGVHQADSAVARDRRATAEPGTGRRSACRPATRPERNGRCRPPAGCRP